MHLIHAELHDELRAAGFRINAGQMGENITTRHVDLLGLATGTLLRLGTDAVLQVPVCAIPAASSTGFSLG